MTSRLQHLLAATVLGLLGAGFNQAAPTGMIEIPAGEYLPLFTSAADPVSVPVPTFYLDERPVTNSEFLAFVQANPKWQRANVSPLFADQSYLKHWSGDLELGPLAPPDSPVVHVSWFAARAYAKSLGKRLPATAEWERAAAVGYATPNGREDAELNGDIYRWLARPTPQVIPSTAEARANHLGVRALFGYVWEWVSDFNTAMVTGESRGDSGLDRNLFCSAGSVGARDTSDYAAFMRSALRSSLRANNTTSSLGFRCACGIETTSPHSP